MSQGALFGSALAEPVWSVTMDRPGGRLRVGTRGREVVLQLLDAAGKPAGGVLPLRPIDARALGAALAMQAPVAERAP